LNATVRNLSDSALSGLHAALDLADAPHLQLRHGEVPLRSLSALAARDSVHLSWQLEVADIPRADSLQHVHVRIHHDHSPLVTRCDASILLEGLIPSPRLLCLTSGHDSAFYDTHYETIVPDPLQVQYSLVNTGTAPATGCSVELLLPVGWDMHRGVNPADFGDIAPGDTVTRSWFITPGKEFQWEQTLTLSWRSACDNIVPDTGCMHRIGFDTPGEWDVVLSPRRLLFTAERDGPLPAAQQVQIWTKAGSSLSWTVSGGTPWLDVQPVTDSGPGSMTLRPNTTALAAGVHYAPLQVESVMLIPRPLEVLYEITDGTTGVRVPHSHAANLEVYPNPHSLLHGSRLHILLPGALRNAPSMEITLHDLLGRTLFTTGWCAADSPSGVAAIPLPASIQRPQPVILSLRNGHGQWNKVVMLTE
jgi:hypothetical protein